MRKIVAHVAVSADGFLARPDGDVAWLDQAGLVGDHGLRAFYRSIDTILWGRKTFDLVRRWQAEGVPGAGFDAKVKNYLFSRRRQRALPAEVEQVDVPLARFLRTHLSTPGKDSWLIGGAELIGAFLDEGAIDEFSVNVIPMFIGEGIPLLAPRHRQIRLRLLGTRKFADGVASLRYAIDREPIPRRHRKK